MWYGFMALKRLHLEVNLDIWHVEKHYFLKFLISCRLEAGKAYYVEVLQKQKYNQDHVEVAVIIFPK